MAKEETSQNLANLVPSRLCVDVNESAAQFMESKLFFDCMFAVKSEHQQTVFSAHKLILAMASPVFKAMFYGSLAKEGDPIPIEDIQPETFMIFLQYIYTDVLNFNSCEEARNMCYVGKKYMMEHLTTKCLQYLLSQVNIENVLHSYEFAQLIEGELLLEACAKIIRENTKEVLQNGNFEKVNLNTAVAIFSMDELNMDSEVDLIEAAVRYAEAQDRRIASSDGAPSTEEAPTEVVKVEDQQECSSSDQLVHTESGTSNLKNTSRIRRLIENIRFLSLTPQQFVECKARMSFLTPSEDRAVLMNIASERSDVPLPSGFSSTRESRLYWIRPESYDKNKSRPAARFRLTVPDFKATRDKVCSKPCYVRSVSWALQVAQTSGFLAVFIVCKTSSNVRANIELKLISHTTRAKSFSKQFYYQFFLQKKPKGFPEFMALDTVTDPSNGYISNGAITVEAYISTD